MLTYYVSDPLFRKKGLPNLTEEKKYSLDHQTSLQIAGNRVCETKQKNGEGFQGGRSWNFTVNYAFFRGCASNVTCNFQICLLSFDTWLTVSPIKAINMLRRRTKVRMMYVTRRVMKTAGYLALSIISKSPMPMVSLKRSRRNLLKVLLSRHDGY